MFKNKSYIGISFVILIFGIWAVPNIVDRMQGNSTIDGQRLDMRSGKGNSKNDLVTIGPAPKFTLTNHNNQAFSDSDFAEKVYVLEFFFVNCPTICPVMNQNMKILENSFFGNPNFGIASITIDPDNDTVEVLKQHAADLGVRSSNWQFLTGEKQYIFDISNKGFNLYAGENKNVSGDFEHSGLFALIDKNGNIRSRRDAHGNPILYYDGLEKEGIKALQQDIAILLNE